jgi:hypothetical protein
MQVLRHAICNEGEYALSRTKEAFGGNEAILLQLVRQTISAK